MATLQLANISKTFGPPAAAITALHEVTLEARDGELLALLGPSGSGKTTLLRLIAGLDQPGAGSLLLDGESLFEKPPRDRSIGMAFQYPALLPQLTAGQNISLGPKLRGGQPGEIDSRTRELAQLLGITELLPRRPETLSGGQQQRVSLARALATRPALLLLDEPLANLDPVSREELRGVIRSIQQQLQVTTLYVTHDQTEAAALGDRIALLERGQVRQTGSSEELYRNPINRFVAEFFAPARPNVLEGELMPGRFKAAGMNLETETAASGPATCVIRPEAIRACAEGGMAAEIGHVQQTGWSTGLVLNFNGRTLRAELPVSSGIRAGEKFRFRIEASSLLFFDSATGLRLL